MSLIRFEGALHNRLSNTITATLHEPLVTGSLLYILTLGPGHVRDRLLQPFRGNLLAKNGASRIATLIAILKAYFVLGIASRINKALNRLALNGWALKRQGSAFAFGPEKKELIVITGGSSGFGYEMVKAFSSVARVIAFDVNPLPAELNELPGVYFYHLDVSDTIRLQEVCADVKKVHGHPSVLINNAGVANGGPILNIRHVAISQLDETAYSPQTTNEATERLFQINIIAHFALIRQFLPGMLRMRRGHIVTIASMLSFFPADNLVDYACTKIGALYLSEGLRAECLRTYPGGQGICTTSVHPGWYSTGIIRGAEGALAKQGIVPRSPTEVSDRVVEQVLQARSGRVVVPPQAEMWTEIRSYPLWIQDLASGLGWKKKEGILSTDKLYSPRPNSEI